MLRLRSGLSKPGSDHPIMQVLYPVLVCLVMYRGCCSQLCLRQALCLSLGDAEDDSWAERWLFAIGNVTLILNSLCLCFACAEDEAWAERAAAEAVQRAAEEWPGGLQTAAIPLSKKARKAARAQATAAATAAEGPDGVGRALTPQQAQPDGAETPKPAAAEAGTGSKRKHQGGLLDKMRARLSGGQFRALNEQLYTQPGDEAFALMQGDPGLFDLYHEVRLMSHPQVVWCGGLWHERGRWGLWPL